MKLAVIYHSETENTKQAAEWIADGMNEVSGVEARAFSIEKVDEDFVKEAKGIVVGSPSYMAQMTPQIHNWLFEKAGELEFPGKWVAHLQQSSTHMVADLWSFSLF